MLVGDYIFAVVRHDADESRAIAFRFDVGGYVVAHRFAATGISQECVTIKAALKKKMCNRRSTAAQSLHVDHALIRMQKVADLINSLPSDFDLGGVKQKQVIRCRNCRRVVGRLAVLARTGISRY